MSTDSDQLDFSFERDVEPVLEPVLDPEETQVSSSSASSSPPPVEVTRSKRSRKTVSARFRDGVVHITIPAWMSKKEEAEWVAKMLQRFERSNRNTDGDLMARAKQLGREYNLPKPASVTWTRELSSRWGSCTIDTAAIRINGKLTKAPSWVVDYVLVHEMAHLMHADHSQAFWDVVARYPKSERAIGFLMGLGMSESDNDPNDDDQALGSPSSE